jgi:hypothetical protein
MSSYGHQFVFHRWDERLSRGKHYPREHKIHLFGSSGFTQCHHFPVNSTFFLSISACLVILKLALKYDRILWFYMFIPLCSLTTVMAIKNAFVYIKFEYINIGYNIMGYIVLTIGLVLISLRFDQYTPISNYYVVCIPFYLSCILFSLSKNMKVAVNLGPGFESYQIRSIAGYQIELATIYGVGLMTVGILIPSKLQDRLNIPWYIICAIFSMTQLLDPFAEVLRRRMKTNLINLKSTSKFPNAILFQRALLVGAGILISLYFDGIFEFYWIWYFTAALVGMASIVDIITLIWTYMYKRDELR